MSISDQLAKALLAQAEVAPQCPATPVLITREGCQPCQDSKEALKTEISSGTVRVLSIDQEEAVKLMQQAGVDMVPQLLLVNCHGDVVDELELEPARVAVPADSSDATEQQVLSNIKRFISGGL